MNNFLEEKEKLLNSIENNTTEHWKRILQRCTTWLYIWWFSYRYKWNKKINWRKQTTKRKSTNTWNPFKRKCWRKPKLETERVYRMVDKRK